MDKTCKYYKYQKYVSYDNGVTWQPMQEFQRGELIEFNSVDCGAGIDAMYKWVVIENQFECVDFDKYELTQKYVSYDNGVTYVEVIPYEYGTGSLLEHNSVDCGYVVYDKYRWVDTDDVICVEEEDCDVDYLNTMPRNIGSIRDSGSSMSTGCITASGVKGENYASATVDSPTRDLLLNTDCEILDDYGNYPMTYMTHLTALTVTNNVDTDELFPEYDGSYNGISGIYGCGVKYPHLHGRFNMLFSDEIENLGCKGRPNDSEPYCELSLSFVHENKLLDYRARFTDPDNNIFPMREIDRYFKLSPIPKYKYLSGNEYWCDKYTKKESGSIYLSLTGNTYSKVISGVNTSNVIEYASSDCGYEDSKLIAIDNMGDAGYIDCSTSMTLSRSEVTHMVNEMDVYYKDLMTCIIGGCVTTIGSEAFRDCSGLTSMNIPSNVTNIEHHAFYNCAGLSSITIPNSVTSIGAAAFSYCSGLTSIDIPTGVTAIERDTFDACSSLTSLTIPSGVTSIGVSAFTNCDSLSSITFTSAIPPRLNGYIINDDSNCIFYVPCSSIGDYKVAWTNYIDRIQSIPPCEETLAFKATYSDSRTYSAACGTYTELTTSVTKPTGYTASAMTVAEIGNCLTSIGDDAFSYCSGLTSVAIPNNLTSIGDSAFKNCSGLTNVVIPSGVTNIGDDAFYGCDSLTNMNIPSGITRIGNYVFYGCDNLESVNIPDNVTTIGYNAFNGCRSLSSITIPSNVTNIGSDAFRNCTSLTSVTINAVTPPTLSSPDVFNNTNNCIIYVPCSSVETYRTSQYWSSYASRIVGIPPCETYKFKATYSDSNTYSEICDSNTTLNSGTTKHSGYVASAMTSAEIGDCIISIGDSAFNGCKSLTSITIGNNVENVGASAFTNCSGLTSVTLPNSVTSIGNYAFSDCKSLANITIPNNVTNIGTYAFQNCSGLTSIDIPNSVESIGMRAFYRCTGLTSLSIGSGVTSIGEGTFLRCSSLTSITLTATTPPSIYSNTFDYTNNCPIYVPNASVDAYKAATNWSIYASRIQGY